jgi:hypothetical protein
MSRAAARAIEHLRNIRDAVEQAARPPGERVVLSRPASDAIIDDVGIVARLVRKMAECDDD